MKLEYTYLHKESHSQVPTHWQSSLWEDFIEPELLDLEETNLE